MTTSFNNPQPIPCHSVYIQLQPCFAKDSTKVNICFKHTNTDADSNIICFYIQIDIQVGYIIQTNTISRFQDNMFPPSYLLAEQDTHSMVHTINYYIPPKYP